MQASGRSPALAGVAAALALVGLVALASLLLEDRSPSWPTYAFEDKALPLLAAALHPLRLPAIIGGVLFALAALTHFTANGSRRTWLLPALLALVFGVDALDASTPDLLPIAIAMLAGVVAAAVIEAVVRADPRTVPAFVATGALLVAFDAALGKATPQGYAMFALQAAGVLAAAWMCARYLGVPLSAGEEPPDVLAPRRPASGS
jgi:hypothetical protein